MCEFAIQTSLVLLHVIYWLRLALAYSSGIGLGYYNNTKNAFNYNAPNSDATLLGFFYQGGISTSIVKSILQMLGNTRLLNS